MTTTVNLFRTLQALVPQPQIAVGLVTEVHADDTSTVTLPGASSEKELSANLFAGAVVRARGSSVPVGKRALLRAWPSGWVVETQAADGELVEITVGSVPPAAEPRPTKPVIEVQPATQTVVLPAPAVFSVGVSGSAPFAYQWKRNGTAIPGATGSSYTFAASAADNGSYFSVDVSNWVALVASVNAVLYVREKPTITTQPSSMSVTEPSSATFSVAAAGTPTLAYQWRRAGAAIAGATLPTYTTPSTSVAADNGATFDCVVSNDYGTITSNTATLTVAVAPPPPPPPTATSSGVDKWTIRTQTAEFTYASAYGTFTPLGGGFTTTNPIGQGADSSFAGKVATFNDVPPNANGNVFSSVFLDSFVDSRTPSGKFVAEFVLTQVSGFKDMCIGFMVTKNGRTYSILPMVHQVGKFYLSFMSGTTNVTFPELVQGDVVGVVWDNTLAYSATVSVYVNGTLVASGTNGDQWSGSVNIFVGRYYPAL